jgi:hypothetical protein
MSASASGPIGWLQPSFMPASISSALARPSASTKMASLIIGQRMRFTTKPGLLLHRDRRLAEALARASTAACVSSEVCRPRISSTSAISGTGLKKCMPMNLPARPVAAASWVIEIDEVLLAMMRVGADRGLDLLEDLELEAEVLGGRLDHEVGAGSAARPSSA